jgi:uncharacterized protein YqhQ
MYGGQAVIRGVMMRSPRFFSVACRRENGEVCVRVEPVPFHRRPAVLKWPLVRGAMALVDALRLGVRALLWSASIAVEDIEQSDSAASKRQKREAERARRIAGSAINDIAVGGALVSGLGIGIFLFIILPNLISGWLHPGLIQSRFALNAVEGVLRITFFLVYVSLIGLMPNIREVFQYHGAEHRAINTFEAGRPLELDQTRDFGVIHVRCGTNFILIVLVLSIFAFSFLPWTSPIERVLMRLALLPVVAGVAYEIIRFAARRPGGLLKALLAPGLWLQRITTRPPSDDQVEVGLTALRAVIEAENGEKQKEAAEPSPAAAAG